MHACVLVLVVACWNLPLGFYSHACTYAVTIATSTMDSE